MGKRLLISLVATFLNLVPMIQLLLLAVSFILSAFVSLEYEPYFLPCLNALDVRLSAATCALLLFGMVFFTGRQSNGEQTFATVLVILLVIVVFAMITFAMYQELTVIRTARSGKQTVRVREREFWKYVRKDCEDWEDQDLAQTLRAYGSGQRPTGAVFDDFGGDQYQEGLLMTLEEVDGDTDDLDGRLFTLSEM